MAGIITRSHSIVYVNVKLTLQDNDYNILLAVLEHLCADVIIGQDVIIGLNVNFGGSKPALSICALSTLSISPPSLLENLTEECKHIAVKSRHYT